MCLLLLSYLPTSSKVKDVQSCKSHNLINDQGLMMIYATLLVCHKFDKSQVCQVLRVLLSEVTLHLCAVPVPMRGQLRPHYCGAAGDISAGSQYHGFPSSACLSNMYRKEIEDAHAIVCVFVCLLCVNEMYTHIFLLCIWTIWICIRIMPTYTCIHTYTGIHRCVLVPLVGEFIEGLGQPISNR